MYPSGLRSLYQVHLELSSELLPLSLIRVAQFKTLPYSLRYNLALNHAVKPKSTLSTKLNWSSLSIGASEEEVIHVGIYKFVLKRVAMCINRLHC